MIQVRIKNVASGEYTHGGKFENNTLAQAWIAQQQAESPCPWGQVPSEYEIETAPITVDPQIAINEEALAYLANTDWLVIRQAETGVPVPQDVLDERAAARLRVVR